ncbi:MAG TPA: PHP domain-containing protein [Patescibacteria group bacterium]|nr:PHP domain-containing protein [Patescibacteria group bacterium]
MSAPAYAELHAHSSFSFLDGASAPVDLVTRAVELGLSGLAVTDRQGLYGVVRFAAAAEEVGLHPVIGVEVELTDALVPDPHGLVIPARRPPPRKHHREPSAPPPVPRGGLPARPRPARASLPGHREAVREDHRGVGEEERGPHLVLLARDDAGYRSLCRLVSRANLAGTKAAPRVTQALLAEHAEGLVAVSGCRHGELARRLLAGDREGARAVAEGYARVFGRVPRASGAVAGSAVARTGFVLELSHHLLPGDDWLVAETARLAGEAGLPVVVTNDVRYARPDDRELHDVLAAIRHGRSVETLAELRTPSGEHYLKSGPELAGLPPGDALTDAATAAAWHEGIANAGELAAVCRVDLGFAQYRFPGFPVPAGETSFSYLAELCHDGIRRRYHPVTPAVVTQLAHELDVIERTGLAEFFLICWDLMRFAKERRIPAQGRGSAADSVVAYVLGITRVDPIRHNLLFERFINEGRTTYPDVDIDFSSERREEVIQYVYERYGAEHTGMVCNLVTYRARSAVREVGIALGFPRPLVDRVAKALETYDSALVRRDLEADGGFAEFFRRPNEAGAGAAGNGRAPGLGGSRPATRPGGTSDDKGGPGDSPASVAWIARVAPELPPTPRGGSTVGMSPWERWLELCARLDGFPRHLSIHSGGMLVTAAPLIDIAPLERATMPGRVVVQFDKRDVETLKLIKLDLLGLGMLAAIDETIQLIEHDCAVCVDLDRLPEEVPEVFAMLQAADTVGVFQVESRAQMQTLPKSRPACLDDLVVEVAIIRPGPIQGNAVHPYLRRRQGIEPVTYLHPSLEPVLRESLGVILYQEQVMRIAIEVAGFTPAESDGFRRAMGTWRSPAEMEKLHGRFVDGCVAVQGMPGEDAEELYRRVAGFASFGFAKSHAAAFARTAYESSFLKLFYPAQFLVGLVNAQPMGFYPVEVLVNDAKRHGVAVLPVDVNASSCRTTTEWVGRPGWALAGPAGDEGRHDGDPGEPLPPGLGIAARPRPVRSAACAIPTHAARERWTPESTVGWGVRLGLGLVKGIGAEHAAHLDAERSRGPYASLADVVDRTGLPEGVIERLIRAGALDSLARPRRELLWQLRETARPAQRAPKGGGLVAGRSLDLRLPATPAPELPPLSELERLGDAYAILSLDARRQVVGLFRPALETMGAVPNAALAERRPGPVRIGGLVVTRQHPMTARGTVFLALEDETGMVNVTLWPDAWARLRGVVRRNALLVVDGVLQRESNVVNVVAQDVGPLVDAARRAGGPEHPDGVRQLGYSGMRRSG